MVTRKTAVIFGATGGIGSAIVQEMYTNGYNLGLSSTSIDIRDSSRVHAEKVDISNPVEVEAFVSAVHARFKTIDVLINSAGIMNVSEIKDLSLDDLKTVFSVNVYGMFNSVKAVLPIMSSQKRGYIVLIGSLRGFKSSKSKGAYCMSKSAVSMFSKVLRKEVADSGIKVTLVNPGFTDTLLHKKKAKRPFLAKSNGTFEKIPITLPKDVAQSISFILSLSAGAIVEEVNVGEIFGDRGGICLLEKE